MAVIRVCFGCLMLVAAVCLAESCRRPEPAETKEPGVSLIVVARGDFGAAKMYFRELGLYDIRTIDSAVVGRNDSCSFTLRSDAPAFYVVSIGERQAVLMAEPGERIRLCFDISDTAVPYDISGSPGSALLLAYEFHTAGNKRKLDSIGYLFRQAASGEHFPKRRKELDGVYSQLFEDQRNMARRMILEHPRSLAMLFIANQRFGQQMLFGDQDSSLLRKLDSTLMVTYPRNKHVVENHKRLLLKLESSSRQGG